MPANRFGLSLAWILFVLSTVAPAGRAEVKQVTVVRVSGEQHIAAAPGVLWPLITQGRNVATWCPQWKAQANAKINLARVGDSMEFKDEWGNGGRSVVTYLVRNRELRVAHEPNDGSYMCQARFTLTPADGGTMLRYLDQYTDEGSPQDREANQKKMEEEMRQSLAALKAAAEKKP